ncbi:MAG: putative DNA-binding domain-containing protein [Rickettsiales bacterium]
MLLPKFQSQFVSAALAHDETPLGALLPADAAITPRDRMGVYHANVVLGLRDVLGETYSAVCKLVGEEFFTQLARDYVAAHPPQLGDVNQYGAQFAAFIAQYAPAQSLGYLADVARFEWAWNRAFLAHNDTAFNAETLAATGPETLLEKPLRLRQSSQLVALDYPADAIWRFCEMQADAPEIVARRRWLLVQRPGLEVEILTLTHAEFLALGALIRQIPLQQALAEAMEADARFDPTAFLSRHVASQSFAADEI